MTKVDAATRALLGAITARLNITDARLELIVRRLDELEGPSCAITGEVVRLPKFKLKDIKARKFKLKDINARLEGDDIA